MDMDVVGGMVNWGLINNLVCLCTCVLPVLTCLLCKVSEWMMGARECMRVWGGGTNNVSVTFPSWG